MAEAKLKRIVYEVKDWYTEEIQLPAPPANCRWRLEMCAGQVSLDFSRTITGFDARISDDGKHLILRMTSEKNVRVGGNSSLDYYHLMPAFITITITS